jgi:uncharacterized membrane protein
MKKRRAVLGGMLLWCMAAEARAQEACKSVPIPPLEGDRYAQVAGLNDWGQISARSFDVEGGGGTTLVTGFVWSGGRVRVLARLTPDEHTIPTAINDWGQVVGIAGAPDGFAPVLWTRDRVTRLPGLEGDRPSAINNAGQIAGFREGACLFWPGADQEPVVMGTLGGSMCQVLGMNDRGEVVGFSAVADDILYGFIWRDGEFQVAHNAPGFVDGTRTISGSQLVDINDRGLAVGSAWTPRGYEFVRWTGQGDLQTLTDPGVIAGAINGWGWAAGIVGSSNLVLVDRTGEARHAGTLTGPVGLPQLHMNDRFQLAWNTNDLRSYFCQLRAPR